jgi:hypothetical protein
VHLPDPHSQHGSSQVRACASMEIWRYQVIEPCLFRHERSVFDSTYVCSSCCWGRHKAADMSHLLRMSSTTARASRLLRVHLRCARGGHVANSFSPPATTGALAPESLGRAAGITQPVQYVSHCRPSFEAEIKREQELRSAGALAARSITTGFGCMIGATTDHHRSEEEGERRSCTYL